MMKRYLSTKFGINMPDGFWENGFYGRTDGQTDGRRMPAWRQQLCCAVAQAELKMKNFNHYLSLKFGVNPLYSFRENYVYRRTTDAHDSSSAVQ